MNGSIHTWGRRVLCALVVFCTPAFAATEYLDQNWSPTESDKFYKTSQGSRLIPRAWFLALERHDSPDLFKADCLARYGYLSTTETCLKRHELPIGFAVDATQKNSWIGMTCAACHTSEIKYQNTTLRIDGAPSGAAMFEFLSDLDQALQRTLSDQQVFLRFAKRVLGPQNNAPNQRDLRKELVAFADYFKDFVGHSKPASPWGPARLDAFGMIFNRATAIDLIWPGNNRTPNAPVSYPFLWGTSWHKVTQWNGSMPNDTRLLRQARNIGQVIGVFGTLNVNNILLYPSSVRRGNLYALEDQVSKLKSPPWPDAFGKLVPAAVARGRDLYLKQDCVRCHAIVPPDKQLEDAFVEVYPLSELNTDDSMAKMASTRESETRMLKDRVITFRSDTFGDRALSFDILRHEVIRTIFGPSERAVKAASKHAAELQRLFDSKFNQPGYKARPLNGIWATAPYLHNGSVRTLYQLLLPPTAPPSQKSRESVFGVGSRVFDPREVGFVNGYGPVKFDLDTTLPGNSKEGHVYGTTLSDPERYDLIEFLKSL